MRSAIVVDWPRKIAWRRVLTFNNFPYRKLGLPGQSGPDFVLKRQIPTTAR
jgi:hypothetical protein